MDLIQTYENDSECEEAGNPSTCEETDHQSDQELNSEIQREELIFRQSSSTASIPSVRPERDGGDVISSEESFIAHNSSTDRSSVAQNTSADNLSTAHNTSADSLSVAHNISDDSLSVAHNTSADNLSTAHSTSADSLSVAHSTSADSLSVAHNTSADSLSVAHNTSADSLSVAHNSSADSSLMGLNVNQPKVDDFFGFSSPSLPKHVTQPDESTVPRLYKDGSSVEVPDGDFWCDFLPDVEDSEIPATHTSHKEYFSKQVSFREDSKSSNKSLMHSVDAQSHSCAPGKSTHRNSFHPYNRQKGFSPGSSGSTTGVDLRHYPAEGRKVFSVHSKVAPYLHLDQPSKLAYGATSSWSAHEGAINRLDWNTPNFSHLLVTAGMDCKISIWNVWSSVDCHISSLMCHTKAVRHVQWCHSGRSVFSCSYDCSAKVSDVESGQLKAEFDHVGFVTAGSILPTNPHLMATGVENMICMWDSRTPQAPVKHFTYKETFGQIQDLLFVADGAQLVSAADCVSRDSADRSIMVWDVRSKAVLSNQVFQERYTCTRLKLHRERSHFLAQTHGGYIALFNTSPPYKMEKSKRFGHHKLLGYNIGFDTSPDGKLVYSGSAEGGIQCYDYRTGRLIRKLTSGNDNVILDVACHPVLPSVVASCTWGGSVSLWQ